MGRDNPPKERQQKQLARKQGQRDSYDRILIVSEGSKTEPNYFREIRTAYRLHAANVQVHPGALGTAPLKVVDYAKNLFMNGDRHKGIQRRAFERVYAVFDRDDHESYHSALAQAEALNGKLRNDAKQAVTFQAIASVPSFELWLLHFEDVWAPVHRDEVMSRLKRHIPNYNKGAGDAFAITSDQLSNANTRAERLATRFSAHTDPEPFTAIGQLVRLLTALNPP